MNFKDIVWDVLPEALEAGREADRSYLRAKDSVTFSDRERKPRET